MNIEEILSRVSLVIKDTSNKGIARALGVAPTTASTWKDRQTIPWQNLFDFSRKQQISFDWLLTGQKNENDFTCNWDEKSRKACLKLKEILDSGDKIVVPAILSNLDAFRDSVDKNDRLKKIEEEIHELKKSNAALYLEHPKKRTGKKKTM